MSDIKNKSEGKPSDLKEKKLRVRILTNCALYSANAMTGRPDCTVLQRNTTQLLTKEEVNKLQMLDRFRPPKKGQPMIQEKCMIIGDD